MAQPSGQILVDSGNPLAGLFFYAQGANGVWDANNGALLTKTGSAGMAVESGANVVLGNAATHYSLAASQTLTAPFTIRLKGRKTVGQTTNSMGCGNYAATNSFIWLDAGTGKVRFRLPLSGGGFADVDSTAAVTTTAQSIITLSMAADGVYTMYQGDTVIGSGDLSFAGSLQFILSAICGGYSGGSFRLNGALEFVHVIPGVAASAGQISALNTDPYSVLESTGASFETSAAVALPAFSGSASVSPVTSFAVTTGLPVFSGSASAGTASFSFSTTTAPPAASGSFTGDTSSGTITITDLRDLTTGNLRVSETGITAIVNNVSTGALVVKLTGQTSTAGGDMSLSHASIIAGTQYRVTVILPDGSEGTWKYTAA